MAVAKPVSKVQHFNFVSFPCKLAFIVGCQKHKTMKKRPAARTVCGPGIPILQQTHTFIALQGGSGQHLSHPRTVKRFRTASISGVDLGQAHGTAQALTHQVHLPCLQHSLEQQCEVLYPRPQRLAPVFALASSSESLLFCSAYHQKAYSDSHASPRVQHASSSVRS